MMDSSVLDVATQRSLIKQKPSLVNMEPLVDHASHQSKRSAANSNNSKKESDQAVARTLLKKVTKKSRLKCNVCNKGFQKKRDLTRHMQSHVSGAHSERYSGPSTSCGRQGSVANVQRYLTLNMAMAMKLQDQESGSYDRHKLAISGGVSKDLKRKKGLKGPELKQMKGSKKLAHILKHRKMDMVFHSQSQSDKTPVIKSEMEGMIETTQSSSTILSENGDGFQCINSEKPLELTALNVSMGVKSKEASRTVSNAWNILDTNSPEDQQPQKNTFLHVCTNVATGDKSPKGSNMSTREALGESLQSNRVKQTIQLNSLNQMSTVTAMHDGVIELFHSLRGGRDKHLVIPKTSQPNTTSTDAEAKSSCNESESDDGSDDDDDNDSYPYWNECKSSVRNGKDLSPMHGGVIEIFDSMRGGRDTHLVIPKIPSVRSGKDQSPIKSRVKNTFCEICQKDFKNLDRHLITHNGERKHQCKVCGKAFYEARVLDKHETTHMEKYKCGVCGELFSKVREAKQHARIHLPDKPYSCEICKASFRNRSHVRKHMVVHSVRQFICEVCGQGFRIGASLRAHKRKHTGEKPYVCKICGKSFRYSSGLRVHNFSHTSGKPYPCPICSESFAHNYLRKSHLLTHNAIMDSHGELSSLNKGHAEWEDVRVSVHQLSSNSQTMATTSRLDHTEQTTSSSDEPLMQRVAGNQTERPGHQVAPRPSTQPSSQDNQKMFANEAEAMKINKVLGPDSFKQNLIYGTGSRRQTPVDSLVVAICDGSYKSLKDLQRQEGESNDEI